MKKIHLSQFDWQLCGWRPFFWKANQSMETNEHLVADIQKIPAQVPGSAQSALISAGIIKDWNVGLNSRDCEWVEHRHWEFFTTINGNLPGYDKIILTALGLDYSGWILVDSEEVAAFEGALVPHHFDITPFLTDKKKHTLRIIFDMPPDEQGQIGFTSQSKHYKPRFNYGWDWCPRFVPIGIWDDIYLEIGQKTAEVKGISTSLREDNFTGSFEVIIDSFNDNSTVSIELSQEKQVVVSQKKQLNPGVNKIESELISVMPWWPNNQGEQTLYDLTISVTNSNFSEIIKECRIGFKRIKWLPCEGAPPKAENWICEINGKQLFLQGVNWTPVELNYHSITDRQYDERVMAYRDMGCNLLRVWGGAYLEKEVFFRLCDEAGLLVWQEFPLSSSGLDNEPPINQDSIDRVCRIARSYIERRGHHICKLLWSGGNELGHSIKENNIKSEHVQPYDTSHPCLNALSQVVKQYDPQTRFIPASPSGPTFVAQENNFGKGMHHDVHGPWMIVKNIEEWKQYWKNDDALFRSETGVPSLQTIELIESYCGDCGPVEILLRSDYWHHSNYMWLEWEYLTEQLAFDNPKDKLQKYILLNRELQAKALKIAAKACKERFPRCGGFLIWMGHDAFPCPSNNSIIDYEGNPKPAYYALKEIFRGSPKLIHEVPTR